jgi:alcohol dehydrogenase
MSDHSNWSFPTNVKFGSGRIIELPEVCESLGMRNPLWVTDPGVASLQSFENALAVCRVAGMNPSVFSDVRGNPVEENVQQGLLMLREGRHDGVIAFGGGSALDVGKVIAFMAGQTRSIWDFEDIDDWWTRANADSILPIIAVPTTAGTGSEVGRAGVISDASTQTKKVIFHPAMLPAVVISDPELTVDLPANLTAWTGMDALAHCLEAYCAPGFHPMAEGIAVEGMRLVKEHLPRAVSHGKDLKARGAMLAAASMGATAFQKGLGGIHALSHPVGAVYDTHHGLTNAVFMPYVLVHNRQVIERKLARLAAWLQLPSATFEALLAWILELRTEFDIPHTTEALGIGRDRFDELAAMAIVDPTAGGNPQPLGHNDAVRLYEHAWVGKL